MDITKFGLQNFRIFKEHFDFELAPIMVLTGPNNSGKSSFVARVGAHNRPDVNRDMDLVFDMSKVHFFDPETENTII